MRREVTPERLDAASACLVLFDLLDGHVNKDPATRKRYNHVIANAEALLVAARRAGMMVAYPHSDHRADGGTTARTIRDTDNRLRAVPAGDPEGYKPAIHAGTPGARIVRELEPEPGDYLIPKHRWSAFHGTYLDLACRARKVATLVLCGGSTDVGIASTAFAARDLDYHLIVVSDACTSPEADNHAQFMKRVFPRMARVRTTAQVLEMLSEEK